MSFKTYLRSVWLAVFFLSGGGVVVLASSPAVMPGDANDRVCQADEDCRFPQANCGGDAPCSKVIPFCNAGKCDLTERRFIDVDLADRSCRAYADCVIVRSACGGCSCGTAVNKSFQLKYDDLYQQTCDGIIAAHCEMDCPVSAECVEGACVLGPAQGGR
ncbi:MAG: hypothetical protein WCO69_04325 [Candidatus Omnitrophota bacterium]